MGIQIGNWLTFHAYKVDSNLQVHNFCRFGIVGLHAVASTCIQLQALLMLWSMNAEIWAPNTN